MNLFYLLVPYMYDCMYVSAHTLTQSTHTKRVVLVFASSVIEF